ncbi:hypothetical protein C2G38_2204131 [Gigaspora rosea]|uniref:Uncharacterized protein n=1 Tax=Gigaspora rosea TaxID=44941 RepID=A0A397UNT7_9GLOM|nr:hypothetical protein C2G38_2204131 [Gigaspora rosea]
MYTTYFAVLTKEQVDKVQKIINKTLKNCTLNERSLSPVSCRVLALKVFSKPQNKKSLVSKSFAAKFKALVYKLALEKKVLKISLKEKYIKRDKDKIGVEKKKLSNCCSNSVDMELIKRIINDSNDDSSEKQFDPVDATIKDVKVLKKPVKRRRKRLEDV